MATAKKASQRKKRKGNLMRLYTRMNKMTEDAVDREVVKRFRIIIDASEDDLPKTVIDTIIKAPLEVEVSDFDENMQPYLKHFIYMTKRDSRKSGK